MMVAVEKRRVPELRFPGFVGEWEVKHGKDLFSNSRTKGDDGLPIYSVTLNDGMVPRDTLDRHLAADAASSDNLRAQPGDLVYNMMRMWQGAVGRAEVECMISPAYVVLRPKKTVDSKCFEYTLQKARSLYDLWAYSYGLTSDRLRLYPKDFGQIPFAVPAVDEQQKIATFLGAVDSKLTTLCRKRELLQNYKRGIMQKIFSRKLRFKRDDGSDFPDWVARRLSSVFVEHGHKSTSKEEVFSVSVKKGLVNQIEHLGRSFSAKDTSHYNLVNPGDVVYTKSPTGAFPFGIIKQSKASSDVVVSPLYGVFAPETKALGLILDTYFESPVNANNYLKPIIQKGAKNTINITNKTFLSRSLILPTCKEEQQKIADFLTAIDSKIEAVTGQITQVETFKKGLLQKMFV